MLPKMSILKPPGVSGSPTKPVRTLAQEKAQLQKATREFESFFKYQLLKTMRQTIPDDPLTKDLPLGDSGGKETFTDMFDMEIAKSGSGGKRSLSELLYNSLEKLVEARYQGKEALSQEASARMPKPLPLPIQPPHIAIPFRPKPIQIKPDVKPIKLLQPRTQSNAPVDRRADPTSFQRHIEAAAAETKIDSTLIESVIHAESRGNPKAVSKAGAKGLMQLLDSTAQQFGATNSFDPAENIRAGSRFLKHLLDRYKDVKLALAAYNAGPATVDKFGGIPPYKETRDYVAKVTAMMQKKAERADSAGD